MIHLDVWAYKSITFMLFITPTGTIFLHLLRVTRGVCTNVSIAKAIILHQCERSVMLPSCSMTFQCFLTYSYGLNKATLSLG